MDYIKSKINNSYSVVTVCRYNADVRRECTKHKSPTWNKAFSYVPSVSDGRRKFFAEPIANGTCVFCKQYGKGILLSTDQNGKMTILFSAGEKYFVFPNAVRSGSIHVA